MLRISLLLLSALLLTYPLSIYYGLRYLEPRYIGLFGFLLVSIRFILARKELQWEAVRALMPPTLVSALLWLGLVLLDDPNLIFFNPVMVNFVMLSMFLWSLFHPPSMIERIARLTEGELPAAGIGYTRKVTMVWCVFFLANGAAAAYTGLFTSMEFWALYNGLIAYLLIGLLFAVEYWVRMQRRRAFDA